MPFLPPGDVLKQTIAHGRGTRTIPMFKTNTRWLRPAELPTGLREPQPPERPEIGVWRAPEASGMTSSAQVCIDRGEPDGPSGEWRRREPGSVYRRRNGSNGSGTNGMR